MPEAVSLSQSGTLGATVGTVAAPPPLSPRDQSWAMLVVFLGLGVVVVDSTLLSLALPMIAKQMNTSAASAIWAVNAYQLATLVCLLPFANLGDRWGYRRVYLWGTVLFVAGALLAAASQNLWMLVFARALQGVGGGAMMSVNSALVRLIYPPERIGRGIAINSMVVASSSVAGPTLAALVLGIASWRWLFCLSIPLAMVVLWRGRQVLPHNPPNANPVRIYKRDVVFNVLMFALLFIGADLLAITTGAVNWQRLGLSMMLAALVVGVLYMRRQSRLPSPLFPVDLMRLPIFALSMAASVSAFAAMSLAGVAMPFLLQEAFARTPFQAGVLMTAWPTAILVTAPIAGRLIGKVHSGVLGCIGMGVLALGLLSLTLMPAQPADWDIAWRLALAGSGFGLFQSPNNHTIVTAPPAHRAGAASGMLGTARLTGMTLGAVMVAQIFAHLPPTQADGPLLAISMGVALALLSAVCSVLRTKT